MIMAMAVAVARKERPRARACGTTLALDCKRENACLRVPGAPSQTGWVDAGGKRKRGESFSRLVPLLPSRRYFRPQITGRVDTMSRNRS